MTKARQRHFDRFRAHTHLKHLILQFYLETWVRKLLLRPGAGDRVLLVDAFAGEGMDQHGSLGSPVILARLAAAAEAQLRRMQPGRPFEVRVLAIEAHRRRCKRLEANLAPYRERAQVRLGRLPTFLPELMTSQAGPWLTGQAQLNYKAVQRLTNRRENPVWLPAG